MIVDGFLDWAERLDGPANKQFPQPNSGKGIACHSVVGNLPNHSVPGRFFDPNDQASVMFILYKDGHVVQMYPVTSSTWTSGSFGANTNFWAIEAEGGNAPNYGELLTQPAEDSFIRIVTEWENHTGRKALINENILQHRQLVAIYGGGATACASDRYSNAWARINEGERYSDDMTPAEVEAIVRKVFDEVSASYYRTLTAAYWDKSAPGAYSAEPDPGVVAGIAKTHKHSPKGKPGVPA